jgi:hypothetical protein
MMDKNLLRRFSLDDGLYFGSYGLFLITSLLSTSFYYRMFIGYPYSWIQVVCLAMLIFREYRMGGTRQNWGALGVLTVMAALALQFTMGNLTRLVPLMFFYIYGARNIHFVRIARFSLWTSAVVVCFVVFSGYLGIIDNVVAAKGNRVREYLGFRYALYLPGILLNMTALWIYLRQDKMPISGVLIWTAANTFVYLRTDSRISFVLAEGLLGVGLLFRFVPGVKKALRWIWSVLTASYVVSAVFSFVFTGIYNGTVPWMRRLNSMLESRLSLGKRSLEDHGFGILGKHISWVGNGLDAYGNGVDETYTYVDCFYVKILQRYGVLFTTALLGLLTWSMVRLWKQKEYLLLLICASVAFHFVLDDLSFALHYNTFWIAMGMAIINPNTLRRT